MLKVKQTYWKLNKNYKGISCLCGTPVSIGSKSGRCKSCAASKPKKEPLKLVCNECLNSFETYPCRKQKSYCSRECKTKAQIGRKMSKEWCQNQSIRLKGSKSHFWKGGVTKENKRLRTTYEYRLWRKSVFERDDYTCQACGNRGCYLQADHIMPFSMYPEMRFDISNGRTLCVACHKKTDTYAGKLFKYRELTPKTTRNSKK